MFYVEKSRYNKIQKKFKINYQEAKVKNYSKFDYNLFINNLYKKIIKYKCE